MITPWNANIGFIASKLAMAIAAGSTAVVKPSELSAAQTELFSQVLHRAGPSVLHRRSKAATVMSPLQYQKQVRLLEARNMLMSGAVEAASVAYEVGYESPSQFSREYRRLFGAAPLKDAEQLRRYSFGAQP